VPLELSNIYKQFAFFLCPQKAKQFEKYALTGIVLMKTSLVEACVSAAHSGEVIRQRAVSKLRKFAEVL
jgi:hypothetical protein